VTPLQVAALVSAGWAVVGLTGAAVRAWRRATVPLVAPPAGPSWPGMLYAFGAGMSPRAKESARQHPIVYVAGMLYHAGIFAALATFILVFTTLRPQTSVRIAFTTMLSAASIAGAGLVVRRTRTPLLRAISAPDDYAANLLVDVWLVTAAFSWMAPATTSAFLLASVVLAAYAPLGKIRHCVFFFLSRGLYGARLGRRGIIRSPLPMAARR
jgi:hypothetical protein